MCDELVYLYNKGVISDDEIIKMIHYIMSFVKTGMYLFPKGRWKPRKKWLNKQIKKLK